MYLLFNKTISLYTQQRRENNEEKWWLLLEVVIPRRKVEHCPSRSREVETAGICAIGGRVELHSRSRRRCRRKNFVGEKVLLLRLK